MRKLIALISVLALLMSLSTSVALAKKPAAPAKQDPATAPASDNLPNPLAEEMSARRAEAQASLLNGKAEPQGPNKVVEVARGQFVELAREGEDSIWTVLGEFGDLESPFGVLQGGLEGPQHNEIPEPDRSVDNSTIWTDDFSEAYFEDLLFSEAPGAISMRNYYIEQSSGRYAVNGDVTDWVQVPYRAAHYGRDWCGSIVCSTTWWFVRDSVNAWYNSMVSAGMTPAEIDEYLSQYDVWDRYDYDGDGNFDEPDGYIDHFQSVHAGEGQETGGGAYGADAIWSHRWYVQLVGIGSGGPIVDGNEVPFGGTPIGDSSYWIGDYTIEPENGGVGVFAHEFGHDLDLPDLYDTSGNTGGAENSTGFWTLMSSGSYGNSGIPEDGIGTKPVHMGAWEKFQLGWLNYEVAFAGQKSTHKLGPASTNTRKAQGLFVVLPDKEVISEIATPYEGEQFYYSDSGNDLDNVMYRTFTLGAGASLTAQVQYDIELDWDYAYLIASTDGGGTWTSVETSESTTDNPNGQNFGFGITGDSGGWVSMTADLSAFTGDVMLGFRYWTDGFVTNPGFMVDNIEVTGYPVDGAEGTDPDAWTFDGFRTSTGTEQSFHFNAYVAEFRTYRGFDDSLRTGPYNFGFLDDPNLQNWVEHFSYEDGLLISYWDSSHTDNSVGDHPGEGLILPIDAHPELEHWSDGTLLRGRLQSRDSTFGLWPTEAVTFHNASVPNSFPSRPAVPVFNDAMSYWTNCDAHACTGAHAGRHQPGWMGVNVPNTGTTLRVVSVSAQGNFMQVHVNN